MIDQDIKRLDELVKKMEGGEISLEQSLELFVEGVQLVKKCTQTLENAELKVKEILENEKGELIEQSLK